MHPAGFPDELVGRVAGAMGRRFILMEKRPDYFDIMRRELAHIPGSGAADFDDLQYWGSADYDA